MILLDVGVERNETQTERKTMFNAKKLDLRSAMLLGGFGVVVCSQAFWTLVFRMVG